MMSIGIRFVRQKGLYQCYGCLCPSHYPAPTDKAGYIDMVYDQLVSDNKKLVTKYLHKAIAVDPTAQADIQVDSRFEPVLDSMISL